MAAGLAASGNAPGGASAFDREQCGWGYQPAAAAQGTVAPLSDGHWTRTAGNGSDLSSTADGSGNDPTGHDVAVSADGLTIAQAGARAVAVYRWESSLDRHVQLGATIGELFDLDDRFELREGSLKVWQRRHYFGIIGTLFYFSAL